jgi:hypothetical protein
MRLDTVKRKNASDTIAALQSTRMRALHDQQQQTDIHITKSLLSTGNLVSVV